jgi:predicted nuclease of predicted toxin-antitoxin system
VNRWLIDAQLPVRLAHAWRAAGHDVVHTSELSAGNATSDEELNRLSLQQQRVLVTKDADFVETYLRYGKPYKLLLVSTGNVSNAELMTLFDTYLTQIAELFESCSYIEVNRTLLLIHQ